MADFLGTLGGVLSQQFSVGENKLKSLDIVRNGNTVPYGYLGQFANKFDQTAERSYTEEGMYRNDLFNPKNKQLEIWMQEPDVTILVKKRAFSSLADNYRTDLLNKDERLFLRATKFLFQNKCKQIAAYEKLTKIETVATEIGSVDYHLLPALFSATDTLSSAFPGSSSISKFKGVVDRVRTIVNLSNATTYTTWTTNVLNSNRTDLGEGTGVMEFTTAFNISTTTSIHFGGGKFDISFVDPHELMRITHNDIEQAIADATNVVSGSAFVQLGLDITNQGLQADKIELNKMRARRGANPINFLVNPETFLGKRVRAIIDNSGIEIKFTGSVFQVDIDPAYRLGGELAGEDGLDPGSHGRAASLLGVAAATIINPAATIADPGAVASTFEIKPNSEAALFKRIVKTTFNVMQLNKNSRTIAKAHNAETNALRTKLRLHYGTKLMIQPMDVVHIFVNSKTKVDNKILGGLQEAFSGGFLQSANKALMNIQNLFNAGFDSNSIEKSLSVGKDFPNWLWLVMRNQFVKDKSGTQVFAGLVEHNNSSYNNDGTFNVNISGNDNSAYFGFGVVNYKPALDVFNGSLYDPLTPFDIKFDRATGFQKDNVPDLLKENQDLFKSSFVKYKNGIYVGKKPTINNFVQDTQRIQNTSIRKVFYDPDGMVYKWKEGIGTLVMFGNNSQNNATTNASVPPITADPFAGQDIMNALSLLITGEPYNFATFYKAAREFDNMGRDPQTNADPSVSYFRNFQTDLKYRNLLYGNFVPFKKLTMDDDTYKNVLNYQNNASAFDAELNQLLARKAELNDKITYLDASNTGLSVEANNIQFKLSTEIEPKIAAKLQQINQELNKIEKPISVVGDDISLDYDPFLDNKDKNHLSDMAKRNKFLRKQIHSLTKRMSWRVRANEDVNYFIIDDSYDKDYDIQAFEKAFTNPNLFKSDYITVDEQIKRIKDLLDLEVFADTQGHIQVRPPQYNKVPSSVFYRMLRLKNEFDIQLYPQFLEDLYVNQIENILSRIEVLEDEIRMYGLALGKSSDQDLISFLSTRTLFIRANTAFTPFQFISDEDTGATSRIVLQDLSKTNDADAAANVFAEGLHALDSVKTQSKINDIFSVSTRASLLKDLGGSKGLITAQVATSLSDTSTRSRKDIISARLQQKTGQSFDLRQLFPGSDQQVGINVREVDLLKITQDLAVRIAERQRILKIAATALQNAEEGLSLIQNKDTNGNKIIKSNLFNVKNIPQALENLLEDESYDDYGPNSGSRYIITNQHIKSMTIAEAAPKFTAVEVQGKFGDNFSYNLPQELNGFDGGGNALTTATAVDYDMWRMYGIRLPQSVSAPYLTDPQTQCAPFAVALLNKSRKQIQSGTVNIIGNEYMQPGEVVYLQNQDILYYVESVNHRITYGKDFETTLNVSYGHMPGEYIPTYLDTIGKILYRNRDITNMVNVRQNNVNNEENIGTIIGSLSSNLTPAESILKGTNAVQNRQSLIAILQSAETAFNVSSANYQPELELRIFYASQGQFPARSVSALEIGTAIKEFLLGENNLYEQAKVKQPEKWLKNFKDHINVVSVDSDDPEEFRSPSTAAYAMARASLTKRSEKNADTFVAKVDGAVHNYIVDCYMYFKNKE